MVLILKNECGNGGKGGNGATARVVEEDEEGLGMEGWEEQWKGEFSS